MEVGNSIMMCNGVTFVQFCKFPRIYLSSGLSKTPLQPSGTYLRSFQLRSLEKRPVGFSCLGLQTNLRPTISSSR